MIPSIVVIGAILTLAALIIIVFLIRAQFSLAPWVPSKISMVAHALEYIHPTPGMRFADLGCGDGRVLFHVYRTYHLQVTGYELSLLPFMIAKLRQILYPTTAISIIWKDLYTAALDQFDIIFIYGLPRTINEKIEPKLIREVRTGTYIISYNFSFRDRKPLKEFHERWRNVYVYRF